MKDNAQGEQQEHEQLQEQDKLGGTRHIENHYEKTLKWAHESTISDPSQISHNYLCPTIINFKEV
jgi:hypothetical protein